MTIYSECVTGIVQSVKGVVKAVRALMRLCVSCLPAAITGVERENTSLQSSSVLTVCKALKNGHEFYSLAPAYDRGATVRVSALR